MCLFKKMSVKSWILDRTVPRGPKLVILFREPKCAFNSSLHRFALQIDRFSQLMSIRKLNIEVKLKRAALVNFCVSNHHLSSLRGCIFVPAASEVNYFSSSDFDTYSKVNSVKTFSCRKCFQKIEE